METCLVIGGGILGTMHAYFAIREGFRVVHLERDIEPNAASTRNFGLIWVSGRASGEELEIAIRAREIWGEIGREIPETGFRSFGSLTVAKSESEFEVMRRAANMSDAEQRGFTLLNHNELRKLEPDLSPSLIGALRCSKDAIVEPHQVLGAIRKILIKNSNYSWLPETEVVDISINEDFCLVRTSDGREFKGDYGVLAPGAEHGGVFKEFFDGESIRRVRLQMAAIEGQAIRLRHSIADGDSLRYYPAYKDCGLENLEIQNSTASRYHMQLLLTQRLDGSLTIGDTHEYEEPLNSVLQEEPYEYLSHVVETIVKVKPTFIRKWSGIYSQVTGSRVYFRKQLSKRIHLVSGLGGRGNTISPAVAEETIRQWRLT